MQMIFSFIVATFYGMAKAQGTSFSLVSFYSGKCVDVSDGSTSNSANIQQYSCNGTPAQQWVWSRYGMLVNPTSNKCVTVAHHGGTDGSNIDLYECYHDGQPCTDPFECAGQDNQLWVWSGNSLKNRISDKCLDVADWGVSDGANIQLWTCDNNANQRWNASFSLINAFSNDCMTAGDGQGASVMHDDCNGRPTEQWVWRGNMLVNMNSNQCITRVPWNGNNIRLQDCSNAENQQWVWQGDKIVNPSSGDCLDLWVDEGSVISYPRGQPNQPNQAWHVLDHGRISEAPSWTSGAPSSDSGLGLGLGLGLGVPCLLLLGIVAVLQIIQA